MYKRGNNGRTFDEHIGDASGGQGDTDGMMEAEAQPKTTRRVKGRHGVPNRLANVDMRSIEGRAYKRNLRALLAEYGGGEIERCRELAALKALIERTVSESLAPEIWSAARARDALPPLQNSARRLEQALLDAKAAQEAGRAKPPPTLADFLSSRSTGLSDAGEG